DDANAVGNRFPVVIAVDVGHRQTIVEERQMKFSLFQDAADALEVIGGEKVHRVCRMAPGARGDRTVLRLKESNHLHLSFLVAHPSTPFLSSRCASARRHSHEDAIYCANVCAMSIRNRSALPVNL